MVQGLPRAIQFSTNLPRVNGIRQFTSNVRPYTEYTIYCVMDIYASSYRELVLYGRLQRVTIPDAVIIQFVLLKMSKVLLETC